MTHAILFGVDALWISSWLTPVWILGVGCLLGLGLCAVFWLLMFVLSRIPMLGELVENQIASNVIAVVLAFPLTAVIGTPILQNGGSWLWLLALLPACWFAALGLIALASRRAVNETFVTIREGVLWPLFWLTVLFAAFGTVGWIVVRSPDEILSSAWRIPYVGTTEAKFEIEVTSDGDVTSTAETTVPVYFRKREIQQMVLRSNGLLEVNVEPDTDPISPFTEVEPNVAKVWTRNDGRSPPFPDDETTTLYVRNLTDDVVELQVSIVTSPIYPESIGILIAAISVLGVFLTYWVISVRFPKVSAIALATYKSETAQPLFLILLAVGVTALYLFILVPYHTFGEDIKVLKDSSLTLILVFCIIQAIWAASTSIADEIEGRTALTVLSKPLHRRDFIIGKYAGIMWTVTLMAVMLGAMLLVCVAYKPIYDGRESANPDPTWQLCYFEMATTIPGLVLVMMEVSVLTALSVAISTRLSMLPNFIICFLIYVLGHLTPLIVSGSELQFEIVYFFGQLIATIFPNLDSFNIQAAISTGKRVPLEYMGMTFVYSAIYSVIALLVALLMFEDRDLT